MKQPIGGGAKKVLYTLQTVKRIGLINSAKALKASNTCKACGLGMGGQKGGMVDESGEFPSVCNKSVQAQSTDIQPPIPSEIFNHSINELRELSPKELEHAGRLGNPIYKAKNSSHYQEVSWDWAMQHAAQGFSNSQPQRSFFYSSGRSSSEAGFVLQLLARLYGTNNVNNCSFYCHQATSVGLGSTIGSGTSTIELEDLSACDLIFVIGANPASNHPRFIYQLKACRERGGKVVVINPAKEAGLVRFAAPKNLGSLIAGGSEIASHYVQPNIGGDMAVFKGIAKAILAKGLDDKHFIENHCLDFDAFRDDIHNTSWQHIEASCGLSQTELEAIAVIYGESKNAVFAWGMGITHHRFGCENVEYIANLALLRGMIGKRHSGLLPLRGHSNVQGIGTIGVKPVLAKDVFDNIERKLEVNLPTAEGFDTHKALRAAHKGEIDAALIMGGNLYSATPDSLWAQQALSRIGLKVFLTTTLNQGHLYGIDDSEALILPVTARDEETQSTTQESMFNFVRLSDGGIKRLANVRSEVAILADLGKRLIDKDTYDFDAFTSHQKIREAIASTVPGMEQLADIGIAKQEFHVRGRLLHAPEFKTDSGKAHFVTHALPEANRNKQEFPYLMATVRSEGQFNSIIYETTDSYRFNAGRDTVFMNEHDIAKLGLKAGDKANVVSANGELNNQTVMAYELPPGNIMAYYPEANVLTGQDLDPRSQTPNFKSVPVRVLNTLST